MNTFKIHCGDSAEILKQYSDNHFDSVVTDPPYGIDFLGKEWDSHTGTVELWKQVFRVLKPGGHLLAFSAARTYHRLATNIEDVGFEIRDQIMWIYSSGFPKAQDLGRQIQKRKGVNERQPHKFNHACIGGGEEKGSQTLNDQVVCTDPEAKQWEGWKSSLKPAHEPIVLARKPVNGSILDNVLKHGVGALNIDATRVPFVDEADEAEMKKAFTNTKCEPTTGGFLGLLNEKPQKRHIGGGKGTKATLLNSNAESYADAPVRADEYEKWEESPLGRYTSNVLGEIPEYQKYFYHPKVSRAERHIVFDTDIIPTDPSGKYDRSNGNGNGNERIEAKASIKTLAEVAKHFGCTNIDGTEYTGGNAVYVPGPGNIYSHGLIHELEKIHGKEEVSKVRGMANNHPTVKPVELMKYLVRLVTPKGGTVLDPFNGSGSTGMAALAESCNYVGCDLDQNYVDISNKRIAAYKDNGFEIKPNRKAKTCFSSLFGE